MTVLFVLLAAACGAVCRYLLDTTIMRLLDGSFPWGTVIVNVSGSLALGVLVGLAISQTIGLNLLLIGGTGFLGAYTTFSTWMYQSVQLLNSKRYLAALGHCLGSLALGVVAAMVGLWITTALP